MAKKPTYEELEQRVKELEKDAVKRNRVEEALRGSETILREVIDLVPHAIYAYDRNGLHLLANCKAAELLGTTVEELTGALFGDIFHNEEQLNRFLADTRQVIASGQPKFVAEEPISDAEGNLRFLQTTKTPFSWPASGEQVVLGVSTDITERKQAEEALGEFLEFKEKIISESPIGISIYDASGQCVAANDSIAELIGGTRNQVLEQNYNNIKSWKKSGLFVRARSAVRENSRKRHELKIKSTFGKDVSLDCHLVPFSSEGQKHLLLMINDISERMLAEERVEEQLRFLQTLIDALPTPIFYKDKYGKYTGCNKAFE